MLRELPTHLQHQLHKHGWLHEPVKDSSCERAERNGLGPDVETLREACPWQKLKRGEEPVLKLGK